MAASRSASRSAPRNASPSPGRALIERLAPCLQIAHQVPGRIRFKFDLAALARHGFSADTAGDVGGLLGRLPGVRGARINVLARSCVVDYDTAVIPDPTWADLLAGRETPATAALLAGFAAAAGD